MQQWQSVEHQRGRDRDGSQAGREYLDAMRRQFDPLHPSAEGKGLTLIAGALFSLVSALCLASVFLGWGASDPGPFEVEEEARRPWHVLWGLPLVLIATLVSSTLGEFLGGATSGLRRTRLLGPAGLPLLDGVGGVVYCLLWAPPDATPARRRYWRLLAVMEGFNVATAFLALGLSAVLWKHQVLPDLLMMYGGARCLGSALALTRTKDTDPFSRGEMLHRLSVDGPSSVALEVLGRIQGLTVAGRRARDWDTSLVSRLLELRDGSILHLYCLLIAYVHYAESSQFETADEVLGEAMSLAQRHNVRARATILMEGAYSQARRGEVLQARQLFSAVDARHVSAGQMSLVKTALAIKEGRRADYEQGMKELKALRPNPGLLQQIKELEEFAERSFGV